MLIYIIWNKDARKFRGIKNAYVDSQAVVDSFYKYGKYHNHKC